MSKIKVLIAGGQGLVGSRFVELNKDLQILAPNSSELDLTNLASVQKTVTEFNPDWIINFAEFSNVDAAEAQSGNTNDSVWNLNVGGVKNILEAFKSKDIIQVSTDMVFPGDLSQPGPYAEDDIAPETGDSLTWYGWTKNRAEKLIQERGGSIVRITHPVRSVFVDESDYLRDNLRAVSSQKDISLFGDQQISISFIDEVVSAINKIIELDGHSVYHVSSDTTTPFELITFAVREMGESDTSITSSSLDNLHRDQSNIKLNPTWGGLKVKITEDDLDLHFSTWQTVVEFLIGQGLNLV